jgi:hypothetical protein
LALGAQIDSVCEFPDALLQKSISNFRESSLQELLKAFPVAENAIALELGPAQVM